jgi:UDP-N-acetylglucosamine--dolichyl-phosphate N-acetylglucosaminephosphotransferase
MEYVYPLVLLLSFVSSYAIIRLLRGKLLRFGIGGIDINKEKKPRIPEAGGMLLLPAIWILILGMAHLGVVNPIAYAFLFTLTCFAAIGFFDDGFKLFKREEKWRRYVLNRALVLFLFTFPFTYLTFGMWAVVPGGILILAIASLANSFAGLNGWEVGSSMITLAGLTVMVSFSLVYTSTLVVLGLVMLGSTAALFYFNKYPARVFPGDSGTLMAGSFMGCMIFFVDYWYMAICLFFPNMYDILLKLKTNPRDMSQKKERPYVLKDGKLEVPKSGKLDFAKLIITKFGPMEEEKISRRVLTIVTNNTLFWTLLYILVKIV